MARIKIDLPGEFSFSTEIPVRITDLNYGGHVGNDSMLSILHEARVRYLMSHGFTEYNIGGSGMIMVDSIIVYKSQAFYGETLVADIAVADIQKRGCDFLYRLTEKSSKREVARAKTTIVFYDYDRRKTVDVPEVFLESVKR